MQVKRYALVTLSWERDNPAAYMPANYEVLHVEPYVEQLWIAERDRRDDDVTLEHSDRQDGGSLIERSRPDWRNAVIGGYDNAGWTLDDYVLPRLASGGMHGREIDLSHWIMKRVP